jgi:hypothetical protein
VPYSSHHRSFGKEGEKRRGKKRGEKKRKERNGRFFLSLGLSLWGKIFLARGYSLVWWQIQI